MEHRLSTAGCICGAARWSTSTPASHHLVSSRIKTLPPRLIVIYPLIKSLRPYRLINYLHFISVSTFETSVRVYSRVLGSCWSFTSQLATEPSCPPSQDSKDCVEALTLSAGSLVGPRKSREDLQQFGSAGAPEAGVSDPQPKLT